MVVRCLVAFDYAGVARSPGDLVEIVEEPRHFIPAAVQVQLLVSQGYVEEVDG
jgi:hypothetical protein